MAKAVEFTAESWDKEVVFSDRPVLVDFWGPGWPPCLKLSPIIDSIAGQFAGRVKVGKVNVHENFDLANEYDVQSIPRILLFRGGKKPIRQMAGLVSEAQLARMLNEVL